MDEISGFVWISNNCCSNSRPFGFRFIDQLPQSFKDIQEFPGWQNFLPKGPSKFINKLLNTTLTYIHTTRQRCLHYGLPKININRLTLKFVIKVTSLILFWVFFLPTYMALLGPKYLHVYSFLGKAPTYSVFYYLCNKYKNFPLTSLHVY